MNRREMFKALFGAAVVTAIPAMPFVWRELTLTEIVTEALRKNQARVAENVTQHNALYRKFFTRAELLKRFPQTT